jgi:heterodisulfide reductase subunit C
MDTISLNAPDTAFIRAVEDESGQAVSRCYQCGNCTAGCPMSFTFDYPVSRVMRLIQAGQKEPVLSSRAIWLCATCETCTQRCPNNIDVAGIMDTCRHMARREGKTGVWPVRAFFDSFIDTIRLHGRSHEIGIMTLFMLRTGRFWTDVDLAPKTLPKGKLPIKPHRIAGREEVAGIISRFKQGLADESLVRAGLAAVGRGTVSGGVPDPGPGNDDPQANKEAQA